MRDASGWQRACLLAGFGVVSALLGNFLEGPSGTEILKVPPLPGVYFAIVLGAAVWMWVSRSAFSTGFVAVATFVAWIAAVKTSLQVHDQIGRILKQAVQSPEFISPASLDYALALCGVFGGLVGSGLTVLAISLVCKEFRTCGNATRTIVIGTVCGTMLEALVGGGNARLAIHLDSVLPLFLVWQPAVAASIGYGLVNRNRP